MSVFSIKNNQSSIGYKRSGLDFFLNNLFFLHQEVKDLVDKLVVQSEHFEHIVFRKGAHSYTFSEDAFLHYHVLREGKTQLTAQFFLLSVEEKGSDFTFFGVIRVFSHASSFTLSIRTFYLIIAKQLGVFFP